MTQEEINKMLSVAESWVGYCEKKQCDYSTYESIGGNAGGANFTRFGRIADMVMNGEDKRVKDGFQWCAMFIISCLYESKAGKVDTTASALHVSEEGIEFVRNVFGRYFPLKMMAGVANIYRAGVYLNRIGKEPKRGDFVIYIDDNGRPYHIGIVESVRGVTINTIEGNTSGKVSGIVANGGCVARCERRIGKKTIFFKNS